jgi:hypothetical protein
MSQITYHQFWKAFTRETDNIHINFFAKLFPDKPVHIVSVFPRSAPRIKDKKQLWVSYSGEPFCLPTKEFKANLIMEETDLTKRIICVTLFAVSCYQKNCWPQLMIPRPAHPKTKFCALTSSRLRARTRHLFMDRLSTYKKVDSMGAAHNTCGGYRLPKGEAGAAILRDYKFIICFENTLNKSCYLTEKLLMAYIHGAIPIYAGARNALTWLNPAAFLYLDDDTPAGMDHLIAQVKALDEDDAAYAAMYAQPLLRDAQIPRELSIEHIKELIAKLVPQ